MSRRRTGTQYVPITISVPATMLNLVEMKLKPKESRSAWIALAIEARLNDADALENASVFDLLGWLHFHGVINHQMRTMLQKQHDSKASTDEC